MTTTNQIHIVDVGGSHELVTVELLRRKGYLERFGVELTRTLVTNGGQACDLLLAGKADMAVQVGFGPALKAIEKGAPLKVVAGSNMLTVHAIYTQKPDIRRLADLAGRSVGVGAPGALTHQLIYAALLKAGVDPASVNFVPMGNSCAIFQALLRGEVEAGFGETEVFEHQDHYGVHALEDAILWKELPDFPNQASYATETAIAEKRDVLVRTLAAHALLYRYLHSEDSWEDFAAACATALPASDAAESRVQWEFYRENRPFAENLLLPEASVAYLQTLNVAMGLQRGVLPFPAIADMSLARDALALIDTP